MVAMYRSPPGPKALRSAEIPTRREVSSTKAPRQTNFVRSSFDTIWPGLEARAIRMSNARLPSFTGSPRRQRDRATGASSNSPNLSRSPTALSSSSDIAPRQCCTAQPSAACGKYTNFTFQKLVFFGHPESARNKESHPFTGKPRTRIRGWRSLPFPEPSNSGTVHGATGSDFMKKIYVVAVLAAMLAGGSLESAVAEPASKAAIKNVVLVHGAFADGSGWKAVAEILEKDGYTVSVAQPPETSYADDQKYTRAAIDAMGGPVVLVGHSYGGSIISEAGNNPNVATLVYIAAFALDEGESCASIEQAVPQASKAFKPDSNGNWWIEQEHFAADFAADIPAAESRFIAISQVPISTDAFTHKAVHPAWKSKRTWYMVASSDRSINPEQERMMAKRAHATTVEVNASHVAYMSHPKEAAKLIEEAAAHAPANQ